MAIYGLRVATDVGHEARAASSEKRLAQSPQVVHEWKGFQLNGMLKSLLEYHSSSVLLSS